jgi:hypothetical protein
MTIRHTPDDTLVRSIRIDVRELQILRRRFQARHIEQGADGNSGGAAHCALQPMSAADCRDARVRVAFDVGSLSIRCIHEVDPLQQPANLATSMVE